MALKATIFKAALNIADMDRHYYGDHALTIAQHPSETDERMMVRLLAFALHADTNLAFGRGLSTDDEPDIWSKGFTGETALWIDVGLPDERRLRRACGRARHVIVYSYGGRNADVWWEQNRSALSRLNNLSVSNLPLEAGAALVKLTRRTMQLHCTIQDGQIWLADEKDRIEIVPTVLKSETSSPR